MGLTIDDAKENAPVTLYGNEHLIAPGLGPKATAVQCRFHGIQPMHTLLYHGQILPVCVRCVIQDVDVEMAVYIGPNGT